LKTLRDARKALFSKGRQEMTMPTCFSGLMVSAGFLPRFPAQATSGICINGLECVKNYAFPAKHNT
jgi:hypothetical protein